jgi:hypothetical protein
MHKEVEKYLKLKRKLIVIEYAPSMLKNIYFCCEQHHN